MSSLNYLRRTGTFLALGLAAITALYAFQKPFREYPGFEYTKFKLPDDYLVNGEWTFARLMYPPVGREHGGAEMLGSWKEGGSNWTMDYPRSDRHLAQAVRRLSRVNARSVEEPIDLDDRDVYDWPWLYGVEVGHWDLTDSQAATMREFLLRGGFFMCDDFHGAIEWEYFMAGMKKIFPNRPVVEIPDDDPIFHNMYDLGKRYQVPGALFMETKQTWEKGESGKIPRWRGIYDDHGRIMVAICHNMDLGDSWEHADNPEYPEQFSDLGMRIGLNYLIYSMTH